MADEGGDKESQNKKINVQRWQGKGRSMQETILMLTKWQRSNTKSLGGTSTLENRLAVQAAGADPSQCNFTNRQKKITKMAVTFEPLMRF